MEITKSITKIRKARGYSQAQIAQILQTTQQQYSKYEQGKQEIPVRHIKTLCDFYHVTANKLIGIETFMTEDESNNKFQKLFDQTIDLIQWAAYQEHITEDAETILMENFERIKEEIEAGE